MLCPCKGGFATQLSASHQLTVFAYSQLPLSSFYCLLFLPGGFLLEESSIVNGHVQLTGFSLCSLDTSTYLLLGWEAHILLVVSMEPTKWQQQFPALAVARGGSIAEAEV